MNATIYSLSLPMKQSFNHNAYKRDHAESIILPINKQAY